MARCRHERHSWLLFGGWMEWCYVCGAWRRLKVIAANKCAADGPWNKPSGDVNINPAMKDQGPHAL
jgi:hypothetical protein